jgi:hypothetical protein
MIPSSRPFYGERVRAETKLFLKIQLLELDELTPAGSANIKTWKYLRQLFVGLLSILSLGHSVTCACAPD